MPPTNKLPAPQWKKGIRLAVEVNDDIFLATVTRVGKEKLYITFDDGDTGTVSHGSKRILGIANDTKRKSPVPKAKLDSYLVGKRSSGNKIVRPRQSKPQFTEEQLQYLKQYGWDIPSITSFLKLPNSRDLLAFHILRIERSYKSLQDLKQSMIDESTNHENIPVISKLTVAQLKNLLTAFRDLQIISIEKQAGGGFIPKLTGNGRSRLIGLSWARLHHYASESKSRQKELLDYYNSRRNDYTGD